MRTEFVVIDIGEEHKEDENYGLHHEDVLFNHSCEHYQPFESFVGGGENAGNFNYQNQKDIINNNSNIDGNKIPASFWRDWKGVIVANHRLCAELSGINDVGLNGFINQIILEDGLYIISKCVAIKKEKTFLMVSIVHYNFVNKGDDTTVTFALMKNMMDEILKTGLFLFGTLERAIKSDIFCNNGIRRINQTLWNLLALIYKPQLLLPSYVLDVGKKLVTGVNINKLLTVLFCKSSTASKILDPKVYAEISFKLSKLGSSQLISKSTTAVASAIITASSSPKVSIRKNTGSTSNPIVTTTTTMTAGAFQRNRDFIVTVSILISNGEVVFSCNGDKSDEELLLSTCRILNFSMKDELAGSDNDNLNFINAKSNRYAHINIYSETKNNRSLLIVKNKSETIAMILKHRSTSKAVNDSTLCKPLIDEANNVIEDLRRLGILPFIPTNTHHTASQSKTLIKQNSPILESDGVIMFQIPQSNDKNPIRSSSASTPIANNNSSPQRISSLLSTKSSSPASSSPSQPLARATMQPTSSNTSSIEILHPRLLLISSFLHSDFLYHLQSSQSQFAGTTDLNYSQILSSIQCFYHQLSKQNCNVIKNTEDHGSHNINLTSSTSSIQDLLVDFDGIPITTTTERSANDYHQSFENQKDANRHEDYEIILTYQSNKSYSIRGSNII